MADLTALRAEYKALFGKSPFNGWDEATLQEKIATGSNADPSPEQPTLPQTVTVMLLGNHVYLPIDPATPDWREAATQRYEGKTDGRRTRVECHPSLAEFLQEREQAEIV